MCFVEIPRLHSGASYAGPTLDGYQRVLRGPETRARAPRESLLLYAIEELRKSAMHLRQLKTERTVQEQWAVDSLR